MSNFGSSWSHGWRVRGPCRALCRQLHCERETRCVSPCAMGCLLRVIGTRILKPLFLASGPNCFANIGRDEHESREDRKPHGRTCRDMAPSVSVSVSQDNTDSTQVFLTDKTCSAWGARHSSTLRPLPTQGPQSPLFSQRTEVISRGSDSLRGEVGGGVDGQGQVTSRHCVPCPPVPYRLSVSEDLLLVFNPFCTVVCF